MAGSTSKRWALDIQGRVITRCCLDMVECGVMNVSARSEPWFGLDELTVHGNPLQSAIAWILYVRAHS
jgi:hypothetical protein